MKKWLLRILIGVIALIGIGLLVYPILSNLLYERSQRELAAYYQDYARHADPENIKKEWEACREYNKGILNGNVPLYDPFDENGNPHYDPQYEQLLNLYGNGAMGSIEVPGITGVLIVYHGTEEEVLQEGVGHMYGTSLPVGGIGTHSVLSSHTGMSGRKLFTNLDQMEEGYVFYLNILGETLAYKVDKISVVLPYEIDEIGINPNEDYVTLVTCTPYGVNSHRLLVRGTRIPYEEAVKLEQKQKGLSTWLTMYLKAISIGLGIAFCLGGIIRLRKRKKTEGGDTCADDRQKSI